MAKYLINMEETNVVIETTGFTPANAVAIVPDSIAKEDYKFLKTREVENAETGEMLTELYIDDAAKIEAQTIKEQEDLEICWTELRSTRDRLLKESDFSQLQDAPLSAEQVSEWQSYRQSLRDLPTNTDDPFNVVWPTKPE